MSRKRTSLAAFLLALALPVTGCLLWALHAGAWGLGGRSPILGYDSAQVALAAREVATHGRLATTFALPLELTKQAQPPWPLAVVQPGLVLAEALLFRLAPRHVGLGGVTLYQFARADQREWLTLVFPFISFILIGLVLAMITSRLLREHAPDYPEIRRLTAAWTVGLAFYLDPEAQHFACGGFTELPFTLGLVLALGALAFGGASRRPLLFGLLMGVTGTLRANMLWLAPVLALGACALAPQGRRGRVLIFALVGYALPLAPWWLYKWRVFGSPSWDLTRYVVWDGVQGRTWFSLYHLPDNPALPTGLAALKLLAAKTAHNLPRLLLDVLTGPRALWLGALIVWMLMAWPRRRRAAAGTRAKVAPAVGTHEPARADAAPAPDLRAPAVAALVVLVVFVIGLLTAAVSIPWLRYVFPARIPLEAAGLIALWALVARVPELVARPVLRRVLHIAAGVLALGWGGLQTLHGNEEARATSQERGVPGTLSTLQIAVLVAREVPAGEPVMSNLGPMLAWYSGRPVLHLGLSPDDLEACRRRLEFRHVLLVFRDAERAWPEWREVVARPGEARNRPEWNVRRVRSWRTSDGFKLVWLELGAPRPRFAAAPGGQPAPRPRLAAASGRPPGAGRGVAPS